MVRLEHIVKRYGADAPILADASLALEAGGFYFLGGASGAGKTTLLKIIFLAERPTAGRVTLFGDDAGRLDRDARAALRRRIGFVFQDLRLADELTAAENVALPLRIARAAEREIGDNVAELLSWVGLEKRMEAPAATLSGNERRRVAIARAIVNRPQLLLADEPTGNLDGEAGLLLMRIFERINRLGTTVLIATHDTAVAGRQGHRSFRLTDGRLAVVPSIAAS